MSLVGFRAKNHPQQATVDHVDDRRTPIALWHALHGKHRFTVDAAASRENAMPVEKFWSLESSAFHQRWVGERVWCNPPYSDIEPRVVKAWDEMELGCELVVMLLPANRCEQGWWQRHVESYRDGGITRDGVTLQTRFLSGRLRFEWPADRVVPAKGDRPPFGCVILTWSRVTPVSVIRSQKMTKEKAEAKSLGMDQEVAALPLINSKNHGPASEPLDAEEKQFIAAKLEVALRLIEGGARGSIRV